MKPYVQAQFAVVGAGDLCIGYGDGLQGLWGEWTDCCQLSMWEKKSWNHWNKWLSQVKDPSLGQRCCWNLVSAMWSHHDVFELKYKSMRLAVEGWFRIVTVECTKVGVVYLRPDWSLLVSWIPSWGVLEGGPACFFLRAHAHNLRVEEENYR